MTKWENVARGISILLVLNTLPPYLEKIGISFWEVGLGIFAVVYSVFFILSKIEILQKSVTNKVGWLTFTGAFIIITVLFDFTLK